MSSLCARSGGSLTFSDCVPSFGAIDAIFFTRNNTTFTLDSLSDLKTKIIEHSLKGNIIPLSGIYDITPASEDPNVQTYPGFNQSITVAPGTVKYDLGFGTNLCLAKAFSRWDNTKAKCFILDSLGNFWGTKTSDGTLIGINVGITTKTNMFQDFKEAKLSTITLNFGASDTFAEKLELVSADFTADEIVGQKELKLVKKSTNNYSVVPTCGTNIDTFYSLFKVEAADPDLWVAVNLATNQVIEITSVVAVDATESFTLTFTSPPAAGTRISLSLDVSSSESIMGFIVSDPIIFIV
jgi:hypothetical protein